MKKLLLVFMLTAPMFIVSCQAGTDKSDKENSKVKTEASVKSNEKATIQLTKAEFKTKVMDYTKSAEWNFEGDKPCIVDFYADWCAPCRITSPILEELAKEYKGKVDIYKVDVDTEKELAAVFGVRAIPSFLYCPMEGKPQMTSGIGQTEKETKKMFVDNIEKILLKE
jgi:thioredoxin